MTQQALFDNLPVKPSGKLPELNPDGYSVKGCSIIYAPSGQAGEYSQLSTNPYRGCGHKCAYCYVPNVIRMKREDFDAGAVPRPDFLKNLEKDARKYQALGRREQVMLSFTTDPFNPTDMSLTRPTIEILKKYGLAFCTLTKGGSRALPYMDLFRPDRDAFASTLTSLDDKFSLKWERGAQLPGDRIKTLRAFHDAGIFTWVSLEPTLDVEASLQIVQETHEFVDLYKVGRVNYIGLTTTTDWETYTHRMIDLLQKVGAKHYIKKDLQGYLPEGYDNPRYIPQHH
jgi:DNA repair photolyase